jgi:hypothetical protein
MKAHRINMNPPYRRCYSIHPSNWLLGLTEGFDTADLKDAKALLDALAS